MCVRTFHLLTFVCVCCVQLVAFRSGQITPEQYKEIKETFEYFDLDKDNTLDRKEFHSCATGIGVVLKEEELNSIFESLDTEGNGHIGIEQFVPFMVKTLTGVCCWVREVPRGDAQALVYVCRAWVLESRCYCRVP